MKLHENTTKSLRAGEAASYCAPITPETCTVLGYDVKADSLNWKHLDWTRHVMIDGGGDPFGPATGQRYQYLHVGFVHPEDGDDGCTYRVRPKKDVGGKVMVKGVGWCEITSIEVAGILDGQWHWRYAIRRAAANPPLKS